MMKLFPPKGYFVRIRVYLAEMYPVGLRMFMSAVLSMSFFSFLAQIERVEATVVCVVIATASVFFFMLILRLMDELKDREIDLELFRDRPLPSRRVLESDIKFSLVCVIIFYVLVNLCTGKALWMALAGLAYSGLMFKYFFIPNVLRRHLLLNLATHNPVILVLLWYLVTIFSEDQGVRLTGHLSLKVLLLAMYWLPLFAWEVSRKIRSGEEENEYVTYSQIFGRGGAVLLAAAAQSTSFALAILLYFLLNLSSVFLVLLAIGYGITMFGHVRFLLHPSPITSRLKEFAEIYVLSLCAAQLTGSYFQ